MDTIRSGVVVVGDEVESVLTAVSAARLGVPVTLVRRSRGLLGGLSTRGGLSYMDITPEYKAPLFREFLEAAGVVRVALEPNRASDVLARLLRESNVQVISGEIPTLVQDADGRLTALGLSGGNSLPVEILIDATPDADVARQAGVPYIKGLGSLFGQPPRFLGVSPVFKISGVDRWKLMAFEETLRSRPDLPDLLAQALPYHSQQSRNEYVTRPCFSPTDMDYIDVLNPTIGIIYHVWRHGCAETYPDAKTWIDGANISLLPGGLMGFNGMVSRVDDYETLLAYSQGAPAPKYLLEEMAHFQRFLREEGGFREARIHPPEELYVRQTLTLRAKENMTAERAIRGGVDPERAIGTFSYWLDLRGVLLSQVFPGEHLPKPVFNVGLDVAFPQEPHLSNLAFVSRSAGYSPLGQGAGRIVQHNAMLGEAVGVAAALALRDSSAMADIPPAAVREVLNQRNSSPLPLDGHSTWTEDQVNASQALKADRDALGPFAQTQSPAPV